MRNVKIVKRRMADGTVKEYRYQRKRAIVGSLGWLIQEYRQTPEFNALARSTKTTYLRAFSHMADLYAVSITDMRRRHIKKIRDRHQNTPAIANQIAAVFSILFNFAIEQEITDSNPAFRLKPLPTGEYRRWNDEHLDVAMTFPERFRRAVILALYTGQRQGDVCAMRWDDYDGEGVAVVQQKTKVKLWIPAHADLRAELQEWRDERSSLTILTDSRGLPWRSMNFASVFSAEMRKHPELNGLVFHGLRKTAAAKLAEAGCSPHEIGSITGHKTLAMLQKYTLEAEQKKRAVAAIDKLESVANHRWKPWK